TTAPPPVHHTLTLHDALPICCGAGSRLRASRFPQSSPNGARSGAVHLAKLADEQIRNQQRARRAQADLLRQLRGEIIAIVEQRRSEEHTSELQSRVDLVCRLL